MDSAIHRFSENWEFWETLRLAVTTLHQEQKLPKPPKGPAIDGWHFLAHTLNLQETAHLLNRSLTTSKANTTLDVKRLGR
jgi:hypothetical protein